MSFDSMSARAAVQSSPPLDGMSTAGKEILATALKLDPIERARLADAIWQSLTEDELEKIEDAADVSQAEAVLARMKESREEPIAWDNRVVTAPPATETFLMRPAPSWRSNWESRRLRPSRTSMPRPCTAQAMAMMTASHVWLVDPDARTLEVFRLDGPTCRLIATFAGEAPVRAEPFDAIELDLGALWHR